MFEKEIENGEKLYEALCGAYNSINGLNAKSVFCALGTFLAFIVKDDASENDFKDVLDVVCRMAITTRKIKNIERENHKGLI